MSVSAAGAALDDASYQDPKQAPQRICVLGGGNFGTAMALLAGGKGHAVRWYCRDANQAKTIAATRRNPRYLSDIELPDGLCVTADVAEALRGADLIFSALPAQATPFFAARPRVCTWRTAAFCQKRC